MKISNITQTAIATGRCETPKGLVTFRHGQRGTWKLNGKQISLDKLFDLFELG